MAAKTAEQMNQERRAAKQRQQAAAKAKSVHAAKNQEFDLNKAAQDAVKRQRFKKMKTENHEREIREAFDTIKARGSFRSIRGEHQKRDAWISWCFEVIQVIRNSPESNSITYNREWKETGIFVAGKIR